MRSHYFQSRKFELKIHVLAKPFASAVELFMPGPLLSGKPLLLASMISIKHFMIYALFQKSKPIKTENTKHKANTVVQEIAETPVRVDEKQNNRGTPHKRARCDGYQMRSERPPLSALATPHYKTVRHRVPGCSRSQRPLCLRTLRRRL